MGDGTILGRLGGLLGRRGKPDGDVQQAPQSGDGAAPAAADPAPPSTPPGEEPFGTGYT